MIRLSVSRLLAIALSCSSLPLFAQAPSISATKSDGTPAATKKIAGDTVTYTNVISNAVGAGAANDVEFTDPDVAGSSVVAASVKVSPLAINDVYPYTVLAHTRINTDTSSNFSVTSNDYAGMSAGAAATIRISAYDVTTANGGTVSMVIDGADIGKIGYTPPPGFTGTDTFNYTITNSASLTNTATVSITVSGPIVWFVNATTGNDTTGNGTMFFPFATVSKAATVDAANHKIFVASGTYSATSVTLETNEILIGQGAVGASFDALVFGPTTPSADTDPRPSIGGTKPTLTHNSGNTITLGQNNSIFGCSITNTGGGYAISGTSINTAQLGNATTSDLDLGSSGSSTGAIFLSGGNGSISVNAPITTTTGRSINITSRTASLVNFTQAISDSASGISLTNNTGATISFSAGLTLSTGTNTAFSATGGGTVTATQNNTSIVNTITTTTSTALNVANTTIGLAGLTFRSISTSTSSSNAGIVLNNTGATGGLTITGNGTAGSGGTIANKTGSNITANIGTPTYNAGTNGTGIILINTANVSLARMQLNDFANFAIYGNNVTNFSLSDSVISGVNGNDAGADEGSVFFGTLGGSTNGLTGTATFSNVQISGGYEDNVVIRNNSGTLSQLTVTGCTIRDNTSTSPGNNGFLVQADGTAVMTADFTTSSFLRNRANGIQVITNDSGTMNVAVGQNGVAGSGGTFTDNNIGVNFAHNSSGTFTSAVYRGTFSATGTTYASPINANLAALASNPMHVTLDANTISNNNSSTGPGIRVSGNGALSGTLNLLVNNNTISQIGNRGIEIVARDGNNTINATVTNNSVQLTDPLSADAIFVSAGAVSTDTVTINLDATGNDANTIASLNGIRIRQRFLNTTYRLEGYSGSATDMTAVATFLGNQNPASAVFLADFGGAGYANTASVAMPTAPLLFAPNEQTLSDSSSPTLPPSTPALPIRSTPHELATVGSLPSTPTESLTKAQLDSLVAAARARWKSTGLSAEQQSRLQALRFEIIDSTTLHLGQASGDLIQISRFAAGNEWFIDATPDDDSEFSHVIASTRRTSATGDAAHNRVDLLTTLIHEMGHTIGLGDTYSNQQSHSVMYGFLSKGERRLPEAGQAANAIPHTHDEPHFLSAPISIGTIPPGKSVTIIYDVVINDPLTTYPLSSQATVSGSNFTNQLTDDLPQGGDPALPGAADPTVTLIDRPDTTVTSLNRNSTSPSNASSVSWDVVFANAVNGLTSSNFSLANTGLSGTPTITGVTASGGAPATTWTITASTGSGSGTLGLNMANDTNLTFDVTNLSFTGQVHTIDRTPPNISSITLSDSALKIGDTSTVTFTFTEAVTGFTNADLTIANGSLTTVSSSDGGTTWTATLTPSASVTDTINVITLDKTGVADAVGNAGVGSSDSPNYSIDTVRPALASAITISDTALKIGDTATVTFTFAEAVTGFTTADLSVASGSLGSLSSGDGGITWTATLTPSASTQDASNVITLDYTGITDLAGNVGTGSVDSPNYAVDTVRPTAGIVVADNSLTVGETSLVTFTFSEAVTGFTNTDLTIANGSLSSVSSSDGGTTWTATLTPDVVIDATNIITLDNTGLTDAAGNAGTGTTDSNNYAIDITSVSIAATTATAAEGGATGLYTFTRTSSTGDLTVNFQLDAASTATAGTDFDLTSGGTLTFNTNTGAGTIVIPNGQLTATATLTALTETLNAAEASETAILNVATSSSYATGSPASATVTITENSFLVTTTANSGNGSLRQALLNANSIAGDDTITFDATTFGSSQTITLASTLTLTSNIVLDGPTASLTLSGNGVTRVFTQTAGTSTISDLTITGGNASGIGISGATLTVLRCAITNNHAPGGGGGISNSGTLNVINSLIANNTDARSASGGGAGIFNSGTLTVINSTISGNSYTGTGLAPGGIGTYSSNPTTILNSTITANSTVSALGGLRQTGSGVVTISNSIIAGNVNNDTKPDIDGAFTSGGGNIIGNAGTATGFTHGVISDQVGTGASPINPQLTALANNGGATQTHALLASSPALNAGLDAQLPADTFDIDGDSNTTEVISLDQRGTGYTRTIGIVDIGAFEMQNPNITKVVQTSGDGYYKEGDEVTMAVHFDQNVTVDTSGGTPRLLLETGATDQYATYVSGSGSKILIFAYTVQAGDTSSDLQYFDTSSLALNGGTIKATADSNVNATLTLPAANSGNSLAELSAVVIDTTAPSGSTPDLTAATDSGSSNSDDITNDTTPTFTGTAESNATVSLYHSDGATLIGSTTADGSGNWSITASTLAQGSYTVKTRVADVAGNVSSLSTGLSVTIDTSAPTLVDAVQFSADTGTSSTDFITKTAAQTVSGTIDTNLANDETVQVSLDNGSTWQDATATAGQKNWSLSGQTLVGSNTLKTRVVDAAGNLGASTDRAYVLDQSAPSITSLTISDNNLKVGDTATVTFTFDEAVNAFTTADVTVANGSLSGLSSSDGGTTWTATLTPSASVNDASNILTLDNTGIADTAGNAGVGSSNSPNYAIDTVRPTLVGAIAISDTALQIGDTATVTFTFAEAVTGFTEVDVTSPNGVLSSLSSGDGGITWTATFTPNSNANDVTNVLTLDYTGLSGLNGNAGIGNVDSPNYTIDTVRPTVGIVVADSTLTIGETSLVTFTFNEAVSGFTNADLTIANGTLSSVSSTDGGITWTATLTPNAVIDATNVINLDNTGVTDAAGNTGTSTTDSNNYAINITSVSIAATDASADENTGDTGTFRITRNGTVGNTTVRLQIDANSDALAADWTSSGANFGSRSPGSTGSAVIPDGQSFVNITLTPKADVHAEAGESVILNITADAAYTVGSPASANVNIAQNDFLVNNTDSYGEGSLRQAIWNANDLAGDDTITFDATVFASAQTIPFNKGGYYISSNVVIQGPGTQLLTLNANTLDSVFSITGGATVRISDLTATNGRSSDAGGGIVITDGSHVTLLRCAVTNSTSLLNGGGIHVTESTLNVVNSTISGNTATTIGGGAISTGAGMTGAVVNILNSTISGNTGSNGGAFSFTADPAVSIIHSTITNNTSTSGAAVEASGGTTTVANSIIAANVGNTGIPDISGTYTSSGGNLIGNAGTATGFTHGVYGDRVGTGAAPVDPLLAPLANNGGSTLTHLPLNGSPVINNGLVANLPTDTFDLDGDSNTTEVLPVDQRGGLNLRQYGPTPDSGSVEALAFNPTLTNTTTREDTLSSTGLVITANPADGGLTTHYKITAIRNGTLYQNDGTTPIAANSFITKAQGAAGLKFLPKPNAHSGNTSTFGFSAQAAVAATDIGLRGNVQSASIKVLSVNDAPTVVAPGLPDLVTTIGVTRTVILAGRFRDVDGDPLTYTVANNSNPSVATASVSGTSLLLKALASGVARITVRAGDGLGGFVSDTLEIKVGMPAATTIQLTTGRIKVNPETGLFDVKVRVKNTTPLPLNGFRLYVDYSKYKTAYPSLRLFNASSPRGSEKVYIDYRKPVAVGDTVTLTLSYYVRGRTFPLNFKPIYRVQNFPRPTKLASPTADPDSCFASLDTTTLPKGDVRVEFPAANGRWYRVSYSSDETHWVESPTPVQAYSSTLYWIDRNPPTDGTRRSYQIETIPAP